MRNLTQKEIDQAPEWATHYWSKSPSGTLVYCNKDKYCHYQDMKPHTLTAGCKTDEMQPIPRKDINKVEFKRRPVNQVYSCGINGDHSGVYVLASEYDAMKARAEDAEQKLELANRAMMELNKSELTKGLK
jgi:hypothetical protein